MLSLLQTGVINKVTVEIALSTSLQIHNGSRNQENTQAFLQADLPSLEMKKLLEEHIGKRGTITLMPRLKKRP